MSPEGAHWQSRRSTSVMRGVGARLTCFARGEEPRTHVLAHAREMLWEAVALGRGMWLTTVWQKEARSGILLRFAVEAAATDMHMPCIVHRLAAGSGKHKRRPRRN